jgi:hypothetical protein
MADKRPSPRSKPPEITDETRALWKSAEERYQLRELVKQNIPIVDPERVDRMSNEELVDLIKTYNDWRLQRETDQEANEVRDHLVGTGRYTEAEVAKMTPAKLKAEIAAEAERELMGSHSRVDPRTVADWIRRGREHEELEQIKDYLVGTGRWGRTEVEERMTKEQIIQAADWHAQNALMGRNSAVNPEHTRAWLLREMEAAQKAGDQPDTPGPGLGSRVPPGFTSGAQRLAGDPTSLVTGSSGGSSSGSTGSGSTGSAMTGVGATDPFAGPHGGMGSGGSGSGASTGSTGSADGATGSSDSGTSGSNSGSSGSESGSSSSDSGAGNGNVGNDPGATGGGGGGGGRRVLIEMSDGTTQWGTTSGGRVYDEAGNELGDDEYDAVSYFFTIDWDANDDTDDGGGGDTDDGTDDGGGGDTDDGTDDGGGVETSVFPDLGLNPGLGAFLGNRDAVIDKISNKLRQPGDDVDPPDDDVDIRHGDEPVSDSKRDLLIGPGGDDRLGLGFGTGRGTLPTTLSFDDGVTRPGSDTGTSGGGLGPELDPFRGTRPGLGESPTPTEHPDDPDGPDSPITFRGISEIERIDSGATAHLHRLQRVEFDDDLDDD